MFYVAYFQFIHPQPPKGGLLFICKLLAPLMGGWGCDVRVLSGKNNLIQLHTGTNNLLFSEFEFFNFF